ncbi:MAG: DUF2269 domain-containing protein [Gaiella sp.]|nr:DUF2269 domain-containing protein [Gaiella sp.]
MSRDWLLFLHLLGTLLFVGGSVGVTALRLLAIGKERPSESAVLLRATRPLIPVVLVGLLLTLGAGFSLANELGVPLGARWLEWTYALVAWLVVVGAVAGRLDRRTRVLAERCSADGDRKTDELARSLRDPLALALDASMLVATIAIVALMVWKP